MTEHEHNNMQMWRRLKVSLLRRGVLKTVILIILTLMIVYVYNHPDNSSTEVIETQADVNGQQLMEDFSTSRSRRSQVLDEACRHKAKGSVENLAKTQFDHIIVNDKYKTLFCYVPKVACSQWKKVFLMMSGKVNDSRKLDEYTVHTVYSHFLRYLSSYQPNEILHKIKHYKKFIMVRNPLERLVSAFQNKFHGTGQKNYKFVEIGMQIVRKYRKDFTEPVTGRDVTFEEFASYVIDNPEGVRDEHWRSIVNLCSPCQVGYDFIAKQETLMEDANHIMSQMAPHIAFPAKPKVYMKSNTSESISYYLSQLPPSQVHKLLDIYKDDFSHFDYSFSKYVKDIF
ncbi:carbohydrate sulfotransferase 14-like isoform X1 [Argopecten irradians]|uniref:carbohydrate sulfotransferase 14-like isoform X1 n=2 Tax=Argopecten irradians TaxID=31199 RepID=UPI003723DD4B